MSLIKRLKLSLVALFVGGFSICLNENPVQRVEAAPSDFTLQDPDNGTIINQSSNKIYEISEAYFFSMAASSTTGTVGYLRIYYYEQNNESNKLDEFMTFEVIEYPQPGDSYYYFSANWVNNNQYDPVNFNVPTARLITFDVDGWNYDEENRKLVYFDPSDPTLAYELSAVALYDEYYSLTYLDVSSGVKVYLNMTDSLSYDGSSIMGSIQLANDQDAICPTIYLGSIFPEDNRYHEPDPVEGYNLIDYDGETKTVYYLYQSSGDTSYPNKITSYLSGVVVLEFESTDSGTPDPLIFIRAEYQGHILVGFCSLLSKDSSTSLYFEYIAEATVEEEYVFETGWVLEGGDVVWQDSTGEHYDITTLTCTYVYKDCVATFNVEVNGDEIPIELTQAWIETENLINPKVHGYFSELRSTVIIECTAEIVYNTNLLESGNIYYTSNTSKPFLYYDGTGFQEASCSSGTYSVVNGIPQISLSCYVNGIADEFTITLNNATYSEAYSGGYNVSGYNSDVYITDDVIVLVVSELYGELETGIWSYSGGTLCYIAPGGTIYTGQSLVYETGTLYETYYCGSLDSSNMSLMFTAGTNELAFNLTDAHIENGVVSGKNTDIYEGLIELEIDEYETYQSSFDIEIQNDQASSYDNVFRCMCTASDQSTQYDMEEVRVEYHSYPYGHEDLNTATLTFQIIDLERTITINFSNAEVFSLDGTQYYIAGHYVEGDQDVEHNNAVKLSTTPITTEEEFIEPGWSYNNGDLIWTTTDGVNYIPSPASGTYSKPSGKATIYYESIPLDDGSEETPHIDLTVQGCTQTADGYTITGYHDAETMVTTDLLTIVVPSLEIEEYPQGWQYVDGELSYADGNGFTYEMSRLQFVTAHYYSVDVDSPYVVITYFYSDDSGAGNVEVELMLTSASYTPNYYEDTDRILSYDVSGYYLDITDDLITVNVRTLEIDEVPPDPPVEETSWSYEEGYLYYSDPANNVFGDSYNSLAIYSSKNQTISLAVDLYDMETEEAVGTKYISITGVEIVSEPQTADDYYVITGYFNELEGGQQLTLYLMNFTVETVPSEETKDEPLTPEQETQIKTLLPEKEDTRATDILEGGEISQQTAADIYDAVSDSKSEIDDRRKTDASYTEEDYQKDLSTIQTVTEAAVVVGAGAEVAEEKGQSINDALPPDSGIVNMSQVFDDFYRTQMNYLLGKEEIPDKKDSNNPAALPHRTTEKKPGIDLSVEEYDLMIEFVDVSVANMESAVLQVRKCSAQPMKDVINGYVEMVMGECFRDYDKDAADMEFVEQAHESIMITMQQQVIAALEKDHHPSNDPQKEAEYVEQLEAVKDLDTFKEIVMEVLRLKYVSLTNEEIEIDDFRDVYWDIFKAWALDDPTLNPYGITLEELTTATIETTTSKANRTTFNSKLQTEEIIFISVLGGVVLAGAGALIGVSAISKKKRGLAK